MRRVAVTGACGLLGSTVSSYLKEGGYEVLELDLKLGHDLTDEDFVTSWFEEHPVDGLVNMFALNDHVTSDSRNTDFLSVDLDSFSRYMSVNVTALFSVCREFIRNNGVGSIVNASSIYGEVSPRPSLYGGGEKHPGYGVSKAAVVMLSRHLAVHCAPTVRVNCIMLGGVLNGQPEDFVARYSQQAPLGRMATPEDVAPLVGFLLSPDSRYMTGALLPVDGGWTA